MGAITFGGHGNFSFGWHHSPKRNPKHRPASGNEANLNRGGGRKQWRFPLKSGMTAATLVLAGDTLAQFRDSNRTDLNTLNPSNSNIKHFLQIGISGYLRTFYVASNSLPAFLPFAICMVIPLPIVKRIGSRYAQGIVVTNLIKHDWLRALRMTTYGFLLYGPGSQAWYEVLDRAFPEQTLRNLSVKVTLNQIVLGPCVIAVIFAWNNLWLGKLKELPNKYRKDAIPTLIYGWKFWIPASLLNFGAVPLQARVLFMSSCSIFWNFYLSTTMGKT